MRPPPGWGFGGVRCRSAITRFGSVRSDKSDACPSETHRPVRTGQFRGRRIFPVNGFLFARKQTETMPSTRRGFACVAAALAVGTAGCTDRLNTERLRTVRLDLSNRTEASLAFHFVLESEGDLGRWRKFALDADERRRVSFRPESDREWSGYHAVAGDRRVSGSLLGQGDERSCLQLDYEITDAEIRAMMSSEQPLCRDE